MTWYSFYTNFSALVIECLGVFWFFGGLEKRNEGIQRYFAPLFVLPLIVIYLPIIPQLNSNNLYTLQNFVNQIIRTVLNLFAVFTYGWCSKEMTRSEASYISAIFVLIYMVCFNIRQALRPLIISYSPAVFETLMVIIMAFSLFAVLAVTKKFLSLGEIKDVGASRWAMVIIAMLIELYFKWSFISPDVQNQQRIGDALFYSLCATLGVLALVLLFEISEKTRRERSELELDNMQISFEIQNAKRTLQANSDIRRLYHDMKNHVIALQSMESGAEAKSYLSELSKEFEDYESSVNTGNGLVDALLSEKIRRARLDKVSFNVCADLTHLEHIHSVDMVTIFGNAVDNAIEAVLELEDEAERIVYIKSAQYANMLVLRFSNRYVGNRIQENGVLRTGKKDTRFHGIGLSSIKKAVLRCGGSVETQFENTDGWFRLVVMLPLPDKSDK